MNAKTREKIGQWIREKKVGEISTMPVESMRESVVDRESLKEAAIVKDEAVKVEDIEWKNKIILGNCLEVLKRMPREFVTAVITDPPYFLNFMNKKWDAAPEDVGSEMSAQMRYFQDWCEAWAKEVLRVLKPGGHLLSFGGTRTAHRMVCGIEEAGFQIRDRIEYFYDLDAIHGQGFPKSLNISKAIEKAAGRIGQDVTAIKMKLAALFDASGKTRGQIDEECGFRACNYLSFPTEEKKYDPWFYVLPSQEKWLKIKEVVGLGNPEIDSKLDEWFTEAKREVIGHQTKARKTDCGIALPTTGDTEYQTWDITAPSTDLGKIWDGYGTSLKPAFEPCAVFGKADENDNTHGLDVDVPFKYEAKASSRERNRGCENLFWLTGGDGKTVQIAKEEYDKLAEENEAHKGEEGYEKHIISDGNIHPTVKSLEMIRYLVKLVKMPANNLILDPFAGSGTTGVACVLEGCNFVGIEMEENSVKIAQARIAYAETHKGEFKSITQR